MAKERWVGDPPPIIPICDATAGYTYVWLMRDANRLHPDFNRVKKAYIDFAKNYLRPARENKPETLH
jgi:hypothetical protein